MLSLLRNVRQLADAEIRRARLASRRATEQAIGWFIVAGLALMGCGMLFLAAFLALSDAFGHIVAALVVGGVVLVIAVIVALFIGPLRKREAEEAAEAASQKARAEISDDISQITAVLEGFGIARGSGLGAPGGVSRLLLLAGLGLGFGMLSKKIKKKSKRG